jgi:hypothetical protein
VSEVKDGPQETGVSASGVFIAVIEIRISVEE